MTRRENFLQQIDEAANEIREELIQGASLKQNNNRVRSEFIYNLHEVEEPEQREKIGPTKVTISKVTPQEPEQRKSRF